MERKGRREGGREEGRKEGRKEDKKTECALRREWLIPVNGSQRH